MWVLHPLQHLQLIVYHLLIALDILLKNDLHSDLSRWSVGFTDNAIGTCAKGSPESVFRSARQSEVS